MKKTQKQSWKQRVVLSSLLIALSVYRLIACAEYDTDIEMPPILSEYLFDALGASLWLLSCFCMKEKLQRFLFGLGACIPLIYLLRYWKSYWYCIASMNYYTLQGIGYLVFIICGLTISITIAFSEYRHRVLPWLMLLATLFMPLIFLAHTLTWVYSNPQYEGGAELCSIAIRYYIEHVLYGVLFSIGLLRYYPILTRRKAAPDPTIETPQDELSQTDTACRPLL